MASGGISGRGGGGGRGGRGVVVDGTNRPTLSMAFQQPNGGDESSRGSGETQAESRGDSTNVAEASPTIVSIASSSRHMSI